MTEQLNQKQEIIRRKFSRAAGSYDQYARVQYQCAQLLGKQLPGGPGPRKILEIGCGTGNYTRALRQLYPNAEILALDFSSAMVERARARNTGPKTTIICTEAENFLDNHSGTYDLITSNATFQWLKDLNLVFSNCARLLAQDGSVHISSFGPETMKDLARACQEVVDPEIQTSAAAFASGKIIQELAEPWFSNIMISEEIIQREYCSIIDMLRHIQKTGVGGSLHPTPRFSPGHLRHLNNWFTANSGYILNYQILFMAADKTIKHSSDL